jgi:hypothetical protein
LVLCYYSIPLCFLSVLTSWLIFGLLSFSIITSGLLYTRCLFAIKLRGLMLVRIIVEVTSLRFLAILQLIQEQVEIILQLLLVLKHFNLSLLRGFQFVKQLLPAPLPLLHPLPLIELLREPPQHFQQQLRFISAHFVNPPSLLSNMSLFVIIIIRLYLFHLTSAFYF